MKDYTQSGSPNLDMLVARLRADAAYLRKQYGAPCAVAFPCDCTACNCEAAADALESAEKDVADLMVAGAELMEQRDTAELDVARMDKAEALLAAGGDIHSYNYDRGTVIQQVFLTANCSSDEPKAPTLRAALDAYPKEPTDG